MLLFGLAKIYIYIYVYYLTSAPIRPWIRLNRKLVGGIWTVCSHDVFWQLLYLIELLQCAFVVIV